MAKRVLLTLRTRTETACQPCKVKRTSCNNFRPCHRCLQSQKPEDCVSIKANRSRLVPQLNLFEGLVSSFNPLMSRDLTFPSSISAARPPQPSFPQYGTPAPPASSTFGPNIPLQSAAHISHSWRSPFTVVSDSCFMELSTPVTVTCRPHTTMARLQLSRPCGRISRKTSSLDSIGNAGGGHILRSLQVAARSGCSCCVPCDPRR